MNLSVQQFGSGPDLMLVHGWGSNAGVWHQFVPHLEADYRLTLVDLPGHGGSGFDADKSSLDDWSGALLEAAPPKAVWLGWSLGGLLAINSALLAPQRVSALAVVAGTPSFVQQDDWPTAVPETTFQQFAKALVDDPEGALRRFLALQVRGAEHAGETLRQLREIMSERGPLSPAALGAGLQMLLKTDLRNRLDQLDDPVLWLLGGRDTLVPRTLAGALAARMPGAAVKEIAGAAHAPFLSHPLTCKKILYEFLQHA